MLRYSIIEIFTSEEARYINRPVSEAVLNYVQGLKLAARCMVTRGEAGCYENGDVATRNLELLSFNMPVRITIVLPSAELQKVMDGLIPICGDSIVSSHEIQVHSHRVPGGFFPRQLLVRDMMSSEPQCVRMYEGADQAAMLLLGSIFTGLPVIDESGRPVGIITQGDLISRAKLPIRIRLLENADAPLQQAIFKDLSEKKASEIMSQPVITIEETTSLNNGVELMLDRKVKRLPVVDDSGRITGILSRLDIFRTVMHKAPNWKSFAAQKIEVENLQAVGDLVRRDSRAVSPDLSVEELIRTIDGDDLQMVAVVDEDNHLLGTVSDLDLLSFFRRESGGVASFFDRLKSSFSNETASSDLNRRLRETSAAKVMCTKPVTVDESTLIEEAIQLMTENTLKRLVVTDSEDHFLGVISRDSLLRTGYRSAGKKK